jgi:hypothetical protein
MAKQTHWIVRVDRGVRYAKIIETKTLREARKLADRLKGTVHRGYGSGSDKSYGEALS